MKIVARHNKQEFKIIIYWIMFKILNRIWILSYNKFWKKWMKYKSWFKKVNMINLAESKAKIDNCMKKIRKVMLILHLNEL